MDKQLYETYILKIATECSITKAAKALGISQPALSMGLTQFEKALGFPVFNRKTVPISLTAPGERYIQYLKEKEILKRQYRKEIDDILMDVSNQVFVGAANVYIHSVLVEATAMLHEMKPYYRIHIESASVPELIEQIRNSSLDCFISTSKASAKEFISIPFRKEVTYLCVPTGSTLQKRLSENSKKMDPKALEGESMIFLKDNQPMQIAVNCLLAEYETAPANFFTVDQITTALALTEKGVGSCFATSESLRSYGSPPSITTYEFPFIPERQIYVVYRKDRYISTACKELIKLITHQDIIKD